VSRRIHVVALVAVMIIAAWLRLSGLDWDGDHHLHPDERFLTMVATDVRVPSSASVYFDTGRSPLNPANVGRAYFTYGTFPLFLTRAVAAATGTTDYDHIHLVGRTLAALFDLGTMFVAYRLALLLAGPEAALGAAALLAFSVVSIQHAHFFTVDAFATFFATVSIFMLARLAFGGGIVFHALFGIAFGLTLACRINLILLAALYPFAAIDLYRRRVLTARTLTAAAVVTLVSAVVSFRIFQPYAFSGSGLFGMTLAQTFIDSMRTVGAFSTGTADFPPGVQWIGRVPVLFAGKNVFGWAIGPAWGVVAIVATLWCLFRPSRGDARVQVARIVAMWVPLLFFFHSIQFVATVRYFLPIVPILAVATACLCAQAPIERRTRLALFATVLVVTAVWAVAFTAIYRRPHSRVEASTWIYQNVAGNTTIATEHWDDALPLPLGRETPDLYQHVELKLYDEENENKRRELIAALDAAETIVLSSNRLYRSIPRVPWKYPLGRRYYELLFAGELGFRLERVFTSYPRIGPLEIVDDDAEEALTVYDHPKVLIFRKTPAYTHDRAASLLGSVSLANLVRVPPNEYSALYRSLHPADVALAGERTARTAVAATGGGSMESLGRWVVMLEILSVALFILLFRPLAAAADRGYGLAKVLAWLAPGTLVWLLASAGLAPQTVGTARLAAAAIVAAAVAVGWRNRGDLRQWFAQRAHRLDVFTLEALFLAIFAVFTGLRAFNPAVAWGEKPMDYAILNAFLRSPGVPPADPWFAGESLNYFYFGHALTGVFANLSGVSAAFAFNLAIPTLAALLSTSAFVFFRQMNVRLAASVLGASAVVLVGNFAGPRLLAGGSRIGFDYFWATSRVIPNTINEYPFWSLAFADLHAHVLALPLEATLVYLGTLWMARGAGGERVNSALTALLIAWLLGAVAVTSSWSIPATVVLQLGFLLTAWRGDGGTRRGFVRALALWVAIVIAARVLFWSFWSHYIAPTNQWGWIRAEKAGLGDVITIFGLFLLVTVPLLARRLVDAMRPTSASAVFVTALLVAAVATFLRSATCGMFAGIAVIGCAAWLVEEAGPMRTAALLIASAAGLGVVTETVFIWDRMNTIFKLYLQMWLLLACGSTLLAWEVVHRAASLPRRLAGAAIAIVFAAGAFTSMTGAAGLLREPRVRSTVPTLDGLAYLAGDGASERQAFEWLNDSVSGIPVILEAHGPSYAEFSRVSMNTGLPTVVGWEYHLIQQARSRDDVDTRAADVEELYNTTDVGRAEQLLRKYHIDLVFVGPTERRTYNAKGLAKFDNWPAVQRAFANRDVTIYATPGQSAIVKTWIEKVPTTVSAPNLREPRGVALAADGTYFVADFGNRRVRHVDAASQRIGEFGLEGGGPAEFRDPCGIAIGRDGVIWVADTWNHRVQKLTADGRQLAEWHADMYGPRGIVAASDGSVYVTDTGNDRVIRFAPDGTPQVVIAKGVVEKPVGIALAADELYVADVGHRRVAVFSRDGQLRREWPIDGWGPGGLPEPYLAVGPDRVVWVTDPKGKRVLLFESSGKPLGVAVPATPLDNPLGIVVVDAGTAMVVDAARNRLVAVKRP
jgi:YYY domain-containing protein